MNTYPNLPSISTLLTLPPSPPRIVVENVQQDQEGYLKSPNHSYHHARLSPMLSPIDSSPNLNPQPQQLPAMLSLPPLQGDDPPRRLQRHPSVSSISSITTSPKPTYNSLWSSTTTSPYCTPEPAVAPPSPMMLSTRSLSPPTIVERPPLPPSTQIVLSESGQPILKRRRGRPPSMREPALEGGWTFLTPTVWDVNQPTQPQQSQPPPLSQNTTATAAADSVMNGSMAAFTSSNMDMVLQMPRKKRGRKPKTHIVGNSCFVWKDITASRRSTKVIKEQKAALRK